MNKAFRDLVEQTHKENQILREQLREIQPRFEAEIQRRQDIINGLTRDRDELHRRLLELTRPAPPPSGLFAPPLGEIIRRGLESGWLEKEIKLKENLVRLQCEVSDVSKDVREERSIFPTSDLSLKDLAGIADDSVVK